MQISPLLIYSIGLLDDINCSFKFLVVTSLIASIVYTIVCFIAYVESQTDFAKLIKHAKKILITTLLILIANIVIPSKKTVVAMYVIPALINNEKIVAIGNNSVEILKNLTDKWVKETIGIQDEKTKN